MTSYFVSHTEDMNPFSSGKRTMEYGSGRQAVKFKDDLSYLMGVKAFGDNVSIISKLTYLMNLSVGGQLASVDEPVSMTVNRTLLLLPEKPQMRPRLADPPNRNRDCSHGKYGYGGRRFQNGTPDETLESVGIGC